MNIYYIYIYIYIYTSLYMPVESARTLISVISTRPVNLWCSGLHLRKLSSRMIYDIYQS